jgi:YidC/Oxa1 family membrane protein insertase
MTEYRSPQQDPGSTTRLLLAFALTFLVILLMQPVLSRYGPKPQPKPQGPLEQEPVATAPQPSPKTPVAAPTKPAPGGAVKAASSETELVMENDLYRIIFTNRGGQVKSWVLKHYKNDKGEQLELINSYAAAKYGQPLSLWTYDEALRSKINSALYVSDDAGTLRAPATITFEFSDRETVARKTFRFEHSYLVRIETSVAHRGAPVQAYPSWPGGFGDQTVPASYGAARIEWQHGEQIERVYANEVSGGNTISGPFQWAGTSDQYFAAIFLPDDPSTAAMVTHHGQISIPQDLNKPDPSKTESVSVLGASVGSVNGITSQRLFVGPKALDVLESVRVARVDNQAQSPDLSAVVDFGFFGFIAKPLFLWLKWTEEHWIPNWGWAIVFLTVVINVALLPLRLSSTRSALKMQKVAPQIKAIQEKYRKYPLRDPRRAEMNKELGALYKREKVNPVGGCFPLLLQLPFLFAFYTMLGVGVELRHAGWLWVRDLAAPDPYYLLPIGVVISTYAMQKMTPMAGMDPVQQKMMTAMMPVMLGVVSWTLAAGLTLYWVVGNILGIIQQMVMNRTQLGREIREHALKRAQRRPSRVAR